MANVLLGIHCVVSGCGSTLRRVNQWKAKPCMKPKHKGKLHAQCMCPEPYQFFKFPTEVKLQKLWLERVKRPDLEVNNLTRVCSRHFVEGKPTRRNYFPTVNIHQEEDEADNEEEEIDDQQYYVEGEVDSESPPPTKKGRSGTVSIVPMEMLQEQGDGGGCDDQVEEDDYDGNLTISRFNYHGNEEGVYTNSVTITRVTSNSAPAKPANRFINTKKTRMESSPAAGNRFLKDSRGATGSSAVSTLVRSNRPQQQSAVAMPQSRTSTLASSKGNSSSNQSPLRTSAGHSKIQQSRPQEENSSCPYEIDMMVDEGDDDGDGDSSELSDIGIDIQPSTLMRQKYTSKDISTAKTLSSLVRQHVTPPAQNQQKEPVNTVAKPKVIPVLAVAPKTQLPFQQQGAMIFQPIQAVTRTPAAANLVAQQNNRKPIGTSNLIVQPTTPTKPVVTSTSSGNATVNNSTKAVIAVTGNSSVIKSEPSNTAAPVTTTANSTPASSSTNDQPKPAASTLATYDPSKQQLQITNPVKYIQECHTRIAQLLAEKQALESRNTELEAKVQELQKSNNDLRREIVHQALNAARRTPPQLNTPTFNLVPTAIMDANSVSTENQNGNASSEGTNNTGGGGGNKPRIRYVIRRPPSLTSGTSTTK